MDFDLEAILYPVTRRAFFKDYWEKLFLFVSRNNPDYFKSLISTEDTKNILSAHRDTGKYTILMKNSIQGLPADNSPDLSAEEIFSEFEKGYTIKIRGIENFSERLSKLLTVLKKNINSEMRVNAYITPKHSQGARYHFDSHDVLILQIEGEKHWRIYEPPVHLPVRLKIGKKSIDPLDKEAININDLTFKEIILREGDTLYIPRGYVHDARTSEWVSLHLTIGIFSITWYEVLLNTITQSLDKIPFIRNSVPPDFAMDSSLNGNKIITELSESVKKIFTEENIKKSLEDISDKFIYYEKNSMSTEKMNEDINIDSKVKLKLEILYKTKIEDNVIKLFLPGKVLELPLKTKKMLEFIIKEKEFSIGMIDTDLNDESKIIFVKHLLRNGFLKNIDT